MTTNVSETVTPVLGFLAVISQSWRIFQRHSGPLLLIAAPTVLSFLLQTIALAPSSDVLGLLNDLSPDAPVTALRIFLVVRHPIARLTALTVAFPLWMICADISAHKVVAYYHSERQEGQGVVSTRGPFRLVKLLKVLSSAVACFAVFEGLFYGCRWWLRALVFSAEEGKSAEVPSAFLTTCAQLLSAPVMSNTLLAFPASILDPTGRCWGFVSLLRSWHLSRNGRLHMVGFLILTLTATATCLIVPPFLVAVMGSPAFNPGNLLSLADAAGLPGIITLVLFILGMLRKYMARLVGPGAGLCAMFVAVCGSTAYCQVLWVVAYLASLRRLERVTNQVDVGFGARAATNQRAHVNH